MTTFLSLVLFVLIPALAAAQEWKPTGVLKGAFGNQTIASDETQFMLLAGVLYGQGPDRVWRERSKLNENGELRAWGDTIAVLGERYHLSSDGGIQWSTAPIEKGWKIMPNSSLVAFVEKANDSLVRVSVKDPITGQLSSKNFPMTDQPTSWGHYEWFAERDRIVLKSRWESNSIPLRSLVIQVPTIDSEGWIANEIESFGEPEAVIGGGVLYGDGSHLIIEQHGQFDTINYNNLAKQGGFAGDWLFKVGDTWCHIHEVSSLQSKLYRYTLQGTWEAVDQIEIPINGRIVGVQGEDLIFRAFNHGPYRIDLSHMTAAADNNGLASNGRVFTNGRYIVAYDSHISGLSRIALLLDRPDKPHVVIDTVVKGNIRSAELISDVLWIAADSVYSYDPQTRSFTNEQFPEYSAKERAYVSALPGGVGIAVTLPENPRQVQDVRYRAHGSSTWSILSKLPNTWPTHSFVGTIDGYLIASQESSFSPTPRYAERYNMSGEKIGDSVNIGWNYTYPTTYDHDFIRMGDKIFYGIYDFVNAVSTDEGATWTEISDPLNDLYLTPTPEGVWWAKDSSLCFSSDIMQTVQTFRIPPAYSAFCLDHHCFGTTVYGLSYIKRPTVSVDEPPFQSLTAIFPGSTAQIINVLGESVGTLQVVDGLLAPFDPSQLPMQPLWAVSGNVVVRVR